MQPAVTDAMRTYVLSGAVDDSSLGTPGGLDQGSVQNVLSTLAQDPHQFSQLTAAEFAQGTVRLAHVPDHNAGHMEAENSATVLSALATGRMEGIHASYAAMDARHDALVNDLVAAKDVVLETATANH